MCILESSNVQKEILHVELGWAHRSLFKVNSILSNKSSGVNDYWYILIYLIYDLWQRGKVIYLDTIF